jgi:putative flippase GtrA
MTDQCNAWPLMWPCAQNATSRQATKKPGDRGPGEFEDTRPSEDSAATSSRDLKPGSFSANHHANKPLRFRKLYVSQRAAEWGKTRSIVGKALGGGILGRWLKFNLVGGLGILVQFFSLFLMKSFFHLHYLLATAVAVEAAVMHNFVWHERYTWADRAKTSRRARSSHCLQHSLRRLAHFNLTTGAVSIVGNLALMKLMAGFAHLNYLIANAVAIAACSLLNFLASELWVFGA